MKNYLLSCFILLVGLNASAQTYDYPKDCLKNLVLPSSFTPNGDEVNDYFSIDFICPVDKFQLKILNRWGETIFETEDPMFKWTGKDLQGNTLPQEVYVYHLTYTFQGIDYEKQSNLTLVR